MPESMGPSPEEMGIVSNEDQANKPEVSESIDQQYDREVADIDGQIQQKQAELQAAPPAEKKSFNQQLGLLKGQRRDLDARPEFASVIGERREREEQAQREAAMQAIPDENLRNALQDLYSKLPEVWSQYDGRLKQIQTAADDVAKVTSARGMIFELSRMQLLREQGQEQAEATLPELKVTYVGMDGKEKPSKVDFDVPMSRDGKPFVYEAKDFPRRPLGVKDEVQKGPDGKPLVNEAGEKVYEKAPDTSKYDQLLKYQAAIEQGLVSGAVYEIKGRIDPAFLQWTRESQKVSDVEVLYTLDLPSGAEHRFVLKPGKTELKFTNPAANSPEDKQIIDAIQKTSPEQLAKIVSEVTVEDPSPELAPYLADPTKIKDIALFNEYESKLRSATHNRIVEQASQ